MRTGHKPGPVKCALGSVVADSPDREAIKTRAWREDGILVLSLDDQELTAMDREFMKLIGNRRYGRHDG